MEIRNNILVVLIAFCSIARMSAQLTIERPFELNWEENELLLSPHQQTTESIWMFEDAVLKKAHPDVPLFSQSIALPQAAKFRVFLKDLVYEQTATPSLISQDFIGEEINIYTTELKDRGRYLAGINFIPIIKTGSVFQRLRKFTIVIQTLPRTDFPFKNPTFANESNLASGQIYKLSLSQRGLYRLNSQYFVDSLGLSLTNVDPTRIQLFTHPAGPLPESLAEDQPDDIIEMSLWISGNQDGNFDEGEFVCFYHPGLHRIEYEGESGKFRQIRQIYDDRAFVYLKIQQQAGLRIELAEDPGASEYTSMYFDEISRLEQDLINLLGDFGSSQGSGQRWFGQTFTNDRQQYIDPHLSITGVDLQSPVRILADFAGRSKDLTTIQLQVDQHVIEKDIGPVNTGDIESLYARIVQFDEEFEISTDNPEISLQFPVTGSTSEGWLDYVQIQYRKLADVTGDPLYIRDTRSLDHPVSGFNIAATSQDVEIWDISNPLRPIEQPYIRAGDVLSFIYPSGELKEFAVFNPNGNFLTPSYEGVVENQNIHSIANADLVIVYHPNFADAAMRLAQHRESYSNFSVIALDVNSVYNEFSAGRQDPSAIRNLAKMLYDRSDNFKYLLLFGDGSYDFRNMVAGTEDESFIPVYETRESLNPLAAFPTDDYYALLSDNEGETLRGAIDIAVGRLPAKTLAEANLLVDKIIRYDTDPESFEDWKLRIAFLADDEDNNIHLNQADNIAISVGEKYPQFNQEKIYFDAFPQVITPGGARYPQASERFNNSIFKGILVANYLGHGGPRGWSQERVLDVDHITNWTNFSRMPLIITATCSFTGFDDPSLVTAGEQTILNDKGGAVALFSTVRSVYSSQNFRLTKSVFDTIFTRENGIPLPIGEILRRAKNSNSADTININARKFLLIGDPSMSLALPALEIETSSINAKPIVAGQMDTIRALQKVTFEAFVKNDAGGVMESFDGTVVVSVFDKPAILKTLINDSGSREKEFEVQRNILFKGKASVISGRFSISFVVPIDINYSFGKGKISYYAFDQNNRDASGYFDQFIIGGTDSGASEDNIGPSVEVFMNDENFVNGGITDAHPILYVRLKDENGINQSGSSIGHDMVAILDDNTQNTFILNDFYSASKDDFSSGEVEFPLSDLELGLHKILVKAFDVANNSGEGMVEFIVADPEDNILKHVLNYPNPFTTSTNFSFEHDTPNVPLQLSLDIYTLSGKLVKSIRDVRVSSGYRINDLHWDGTDDFGAQLARGIYLYKIKINAAELNISKESAFEKLVILR